MLEEKDYINKVHNADSEEYLKQLPDESVDLVCCDPPYALQFMQKSWDAVLPSVEIWKECLRVLKPGGFCYVMSAPRQDVLSQMIVRLGEAGFRTDFTSMYWTYASGFPKAGNIGKMVDKRLGNKREELGSSENQRPHSNRGNGLCHGDYGKEWDKTKGNSSLEGSYAGYQPKPAVEVIIVCMKPCEEKTYVDQAMKNGKGVSWFDDCRIPYESEGDKTKNFSGSKSWNVDSSFTQKGECNSRVPNTQGRFPANLIVSDDVLNDGVYYKTGVASMTKGNQIYGGNSMLKSRTEDKGGLRGAIGEKGGSYSRYFDLDKWYERTKI